MVSEGMLGWRGEWWHTLVIVVLRRPRHDNHLKFKVSLADVVS